MLSSGGGGSNSVPFCLSRIVSGAITAAHLITKEEVQLNAASLRLASLRWPVTDADKLAGREVTERNSLFTGNVTELAAGSMACKGNREQGEREKKKQS